MDPIKKRKVRNGAIIGAVSGVILAAVLYLAATPNPMYLIFVAFGIAIGAGQAYLSSD